MPGTREFEALFKAALDAVLVVDDDRKFVDVNPAACRLLGLSCSQLLGLRIDEFLAAPRPDLDQVWRTFLTTGEQTGELRVLTRHGGVRDVEYSATANFLPGRHLALLRDVTERKRAETERADLLQRDQARLREAETLLAISRALGETLDPTETMRRVAREIALALRADMAGAYLADAAHENLAPIAGYHVPPRLLECFQQFPIPIKNHPAIEEAWTHRRPVWTDNMGADPRIDRASYERFPHQTDLFVPIRVKDKPVGGFFVIWWTERRSFTGEELRLLEAISDLAGIFLENAQLYREVTEASRAKDEFLATLSHELRNPLAAISNAVSALGRPTMSEQTAARLRGIIDRQTRHLSRLLEDLLDVARVTAGKITLQRQPVDLSELAAGCLQSLQDSGKGGGHRITFRSEPVVVDADATRVEQVLTNLLDNALKYTAPGGRVDLEVFRQGQEAVLRVTDTGVGIAPEMQREVFDLFAQAERRGDRPTPGLGIGLTVARRLAEMHGGSIAAFSDGIGRGSRFTVRLPLGDATTAVIPPAPSSPRGPSQRVLVIEDNDDTRDSLRALLESLGHRVLEAADGLRGVSVALEECPDIVLIDLGLPALDGIHVARMLRSTPAGKRMKLIAVTGYGQPDDRDRSREAGFDAHVVKPVNPETLSLLIGGTV